MPDPKTRLNHILIGNKEFIIESISNIDELFEELLAKNEDHPDVKDERIPYYADLWPSAIALSDFIANKNLIQRGMKVLELGCGAGLPGIVAGHYGAEVVFSDYIPEALELARKNWSLNNSALASFRVMDWRNPDPDIRADLILASDIAYEKKSFNDLIRAFRILSGNQTKIIVSEPNRASARSFFPGLEKEGFKVKSETRSLMFREQKYSIHIHAISTGHPDLK